MQTFPVPFMQNLPLLALQLLFSFHTYLFIRSFIHFSPGNRRSKRRPRRLILGRTYDSAILGSEITDEFRGPATLERSPKPNALRQNMVKMSRQPLQERGLRATATARSLVHPSSHVVAVCISHLISPSNGTLRCIYIYLTWPVSVPAYNSL